MKALILAAGYARRLHPYIKNIPKPLLPIAGIPLIELSITKLLGAGEIDEIIIVTNELYKEIFERWKIEFESKARPAKSIEVVSDGTFSNQTRRGAVGDLHFVCELKKITDELLVVAGDNFFEFDIRCFIQAYKKGGASVIALRDLGNPSMVVRRYGVVTLGADNQIETFDEKPETATSSLTSTLCYILGETELRSLMDYRIRNPEEYDTGTFIRHLIDNKHRVYGYPFNERWVDIGNYQEYRALNQTELKKRLESEPTFTQSVDAIIFFADIIGAATISEYTSEQNYDDFLCEFQEIAFRVIETNLSGLDEEDRSFCECEVRGDEAFLMLYTKDQARDVRTVLSIAIELKRECFLSTFNRNRMGRSYYDVGIGIHRGNVILKQHPSVRGTDRKFNAAGYNINLTKRIEGHSRTGKFSRVMLSKKFTEGVALPMILSERIDVPLKGIYAPYPIYELQVYGNIEDPQYAPQIRPKDIDYYVAALEIGSYDMWLLLMVARHYYDEEDYPTAQKYYKEAIERYPDFVAGYVYLGRSLYRQNKFREAREYLMKACAIDPFSPLAPRANNFLAITLRRLDDYDLAFQHHENATKFSPDSPYEYNSFAYSIAEAYREFGSTYDLAKAEKYLGCAEDLFGDKARAFEYILGHTQGLIRLKERSYEEAIDCFKKVILSIEERKEMKPKKREEKLGETYYHLGIAHYHRQGTGFWADALGYFRRSLESPEIQAGERIPYYWFGDAKGKISEIEAFTVRHADRAR